jgi:hypothetical protein
MFWEPWFTPSNMNWGLAEAVPLVGRYSSIDIIGDTPKAVANRAVVKQHMLWFQRMGVSAIGIDWTNNIWNTPTFADRGVYAQELINATVFTLEVYASLQRQGYTVPQFVLLLGLDNGPVSPIHALVGEIEYITSTLLRSASLAPLFITDIGGKPLLIIFDGGNMHAQYEVALRTVVAPYTVRWMSSQLQANRLNNDGFYSWMDGTIAPLPTYNSRTGVEEALTITNAFFSASGGWLGPAAFATNNGATLLREIATALQHPPEILFICQWNEYAGQATRPGQIYVDIYNSTLGNDMEPTSLTACGYTRPGNAYCGGWGFRFANMIAALSRLINGNESTLLVVVQEPVPWKSIPMSDATTVSVVLLGSCAGINRLLIRVDDGSVVRQSFPVPSMTNLSLRILNLTVSTLGLASGSHDLVVETLTASGKACIQQQGLDYLDWGSAAGDAADRVRFFVQ